MITDKAVLKKDGWYYFLDGLAVTESEYELRYPPASMDGPVLPTVSCSAWPMTDVVSVQVHPNQVKEATEWARAHGVPTDYQENGSPEFRDRDHRRRFMKIRGVHDNNGGYGDG